MEEVTYIEIFMNTYIHFFDTEEEMIESYLRNKGVPRKFYYTNEKIPLFLKNAKSLEFQCCPEVITQHLVDITSKYIKE